MGKFNDHFSGKQNDEYEYYEDAHGGSFGNDRNAFTGSSDRDTFTGSSDRDSFSRDEYPVRPIIGRPTATRFRATATRMRHVTITHIPANR